MDWVHKDSPEGERRYTAIGCPEFVRVGQFLPSVVGTARIVICPSSYCCGVLVSQ